MHLKHYIGVVYQFRNRRYAFFYDKANGNAIFFTFQNSSILYSNDFPGLQLLSEMNFHLLTTNLKIIANLPFNTLMNS